MPGSEIDHLIFMYLDKSWIHESITWLSCTLIIHEGITWFSCTLINHEFMNSWKHHLIFMYLDKSWIHEFMKAWNYTFILLFYLYNLISHWLNISCFQSVRGGIPRNFNLTVLQNLPRASNRNCNTNTRQVETCYTRHMKAR